MSSGVVPIYADVSSGLHAGRKISSAHDNTRKSALFRQIRLLAVLLLVLAPVGAEAGPPKNWEPADGPIALPTESFTNALGIERRLSDFRGKVVALTSGGTAAKSYGTAEFVAQEEMSRHVGYWWSPDSKAIAYQSTDVSKLERRSDARLSTLSSYVAVLGGVLEVRARFGTLAIRIGFPEEPSARAIPPTSDRRRGITRDG